MVRYFYDWTPLFLVGAVAFLALPWLGVIALMLFVIAALGALAALAFAVGDAIWSASRAIGRHSHGPGSSRHETPAPAQVSVRTPRRRSAPTPAAAVFTSSRYERDA